MIKYILSLIGVSFLFFDISIAHQLIEEVRGGRRVRVIQIDLLNQDFDVVTSLKHQGEVWSLKQLMDQVGGVTAINGVFFRPDEPVYARFGQANTTISERIFMWDGASYSNYRPDTWVRWIFGIDNNRRALLVQNNLSQMGSYIANTNSGLIHTLQYGLWNFPILLDSGVNVSPYFQDEINSSPSLRSSTLRRSFICAQSNKTTLFMGFVDSISLYDLGDYLRTYFNCWDALNLDAGWSSAMIFDDDFVIWPWRPVMDAWVVVPRVGAQEYRRQRDEAINSAISHYQLTSEEQQALSGVISVLTTRFPWTIPSKKSDVLKQLRRLETQRFNKHNYRIRKILRTLINAIEQ